MRPRAEVRNDYLAVDNEADAPDLGYSAYQTLSAFRYQARLFFAFSQAALDDAGLSSVQYQALLAIKSHDGPEPISIGGLAKQLFIKLNSCVELVGRLQDAGYVTRSRSTSDGRRILVRLSDQGGAVLAPLAAIHFEQHGRQLPDLERVVADLASLHRSHFYPKADF